MIRYLFVASMLLFMAAPSIAANYLKQDQFKHWLESGRQVIVVDIQPAADFSRQHFQGSIETNAYPGKTDEEKKRLDRALPVINGSQNEVVIVCPRGGGGAKNVYEYLKNKGILESRLYILTDGINGWPYKEMLSK